MVESGVFSDPEQPRPKYSASITRYLAKCRNEGVLCDVLGSSSVPDHTNHDTEDGVLMLDDQTIKRIIVAVARELNESLFVEGGQN